VKQLQFESFLSQKEILKDLRNYLAGRAEGLSRDEGLLEEMLKCTFAHHMMVLNTGLPSKNIEEDNVQLSKLYRTYFESIMEKSPELFPDGTEILLGLGNIAYIHRALENIRKLKSKDDLIGDIYEIFIGTSYRGQEGQYFTPFTAIWALIEITNPKSDDLIIDPACGAGGFLVESCKHIGKSLKPKNIFGVDKDNYLSRLSRLRLALQHDEDFSIISADSLAWNDEGFTTSKNAKNKGKYSLCLTNPPFGRKIISLSSEDKNDFELAHKWSFSKKTATFTKTSSLAKNVPPQILFIERCISLLKKEGLLGIVLPESVVSNTGHRYVVNYILSNTTPLAVLGMPENLFKTSGKGGTHTKVCLLVLRKSKPPKNHSVFMAEAKWCGHDSRGKKIPHNDIPDIIKKYKKSQNTGKTNGDRFGFNVKLDDIKNYILAPRYYNPEPAQELKKLKKSHLSVNLADLINEGIVEVSTGNELGKLAYGTGDIPFVRTSDISNWEIKADPKHLVSEEHYAQYAKRQDVREGDILMVRDGTYLIGTCAMVTKYDVKISYQSHIFKIRVNKNEFFDNYLLLAILSSKPVQTQIRALSFTLDIIDSLGDRLGDLILPIPKDKKLKKEISETVKKSIYDRIEARELAKKARERVVAA
jgi:type I restriction enzyme M protein